MASQWNPGFQGGVTVRNTSTSASINSWTVTATFANGQTVNQSWESSFTQSGATATFRNANYNGTIAPNGTKTFGFLGTWSGTNSAPTLTCSAS